MKKYQSKLSENLKSCRFSVLTPTFNRSALLGRVYEGLIKQEFKDFEWIIVDDGSVDDTKEICLSFIQENQLPIQYIQKGNGGKHSVYRVAESLYRGLYVVCADDDDLMPPDTLRIFDRHWRDLEKSNDYEEFWEVRGRCVSSNGKLVGKELKPDVFDSDYNAITYQMHFKEEMHGCNKSSVLREEACVPDDIIFGEHCTYFHEDIRWTRAAKKYKTRFTSEVVRVYTEDADVSIMRPSKKNRYNGLIAATYRLNEMRFYLLKHEPKTYFLNIAVVVYSIIILKISFSKNISRFSIIERSIMRMFYLPLYTVSIFRK